MGWEKPLVNKGFALTLVLLMVLSGVPGLLLVGGETAVAVAEEGNEDTAKLLVYSRMIARGLDTLGLSGASVEQVASSLGVSIAEAEEIIKIANMTPQEIFSLDAEVAQQLKEKADYYYDIILDVIEKGIDREELKKTLDQALLQRIADVVSRIGESLNDTVILQAAEQVRNATNIDDARRLLAQVVERLQALNIYMLSETLDDALLRSLERLIDEADMGNLEDSIEKMREEIREIRDLASRYGTVFEDNLDPVIESKLSLALEKISAVETTLESMGTVTQTIVNATGNATGVSIDPTRVVEAGVKARISLLTEKLAQIEAQLRSMLETGMADPQWVSQAMNMSDLVRQHLASATASLAEGDIENALSEVSKADEILTRLAFEVRYKSVEMQALVQARLAAANALMLQVETRINETQDLIERLYQTANATGAQATLSTLDQARVHLQNAIQLAEQARALLQANDTNSLDLLNQALQEVIQAKAIANAARASLSIELQVITQVAQGNQTQTGANATVTTNQTLPSNATLGNGTQVNATTPTPNGTAPAANQTTANGTQVRNETVQLHAQVETRLSYAQQLMTQATEIGSDSAYEYASKAVEMLRLALNLTQTGGLTEAKRLLDQADYYIIKAEKELAEKGFETKPINVDYRIWEIKKEIVEMEFKLKLVTAKMEAANISDPLANELLAKALELLNQSKTMLDQGDLAGALDSLYRAEDLVSYVDDLVEAWYEEDEMSHYTEGPQAQIAEVEYLVNKALAKIEQAKAHPGYGDSTAAQALVEQAYQMTQEAKIRLQEAIELMNQGQDYTEALRLAANLAKGAVELAEQAIDIAEKAWEKSMEGPGKTPDNVEEQLDKIYELREKLAELKSKITEIRASGAYQEDQLAEAEKLISEAEALISQAERTVSAGENAQGLINQAKALLEWADRILETIKEPATETKPPEEETETTTTVTTASPESEYKELSVKIDNLENKAYKILDRLSTLESSGAIDPATASEVKGIVERALAQIEMARTALDTGTDAKPYVETADELLSKAEELLEEVRSTITTTATETSTEKDEQGNNKYEEKIIELEAKAIEIETKAKSMFNAGLLQSGDYETIISLVNEARSLLEKAKTIEGRTGVKENLISQAKSLLEKAEYIIEKAKTSEEYASTITETETQSTTETTTTVSEEEKTETEEYETSIESEAETTATETPSEESTTREEEEKEETNTPTETTTITGTTSVDEEELSKVKDEINDALDKVSDLREKALELQSKAENEGNEEAIQLVNQAQGLIGTASATLDESQALISVGEFSVAQSLVENAISYLGQAEDLLEQAEDILD